ncbi:unnamed protein product [Anisakis simplex]|uniref:SSD domain-containing protein n=1 Tax=Anisakis simplex TaxID=6269 RepID=A0A158PN40_ANISI|nr:unnamed protein product [Anisakis simplex]
MGIIHALEHFIARLFSKLGLSIGQRPVTVICGAFIVTLFLSVGLLNFDEINNVRTEYSPLNAPSRVEYAVAKDFLGQNGTLDPTYVMVRARDGGSLLRDEYRLGLINLTKRLQSNVTVKYKGHWYDYTDLCEPYCEMNTAFLAFLRLYDPGNPTTSTYPAIELFGTQAFIGNNAYGIKLKENSKNIESFTTAILPFFVVAPDEFRPLLYQWQLEADRCFKDEEYSIFKVLCFIIRQKQTPACVSHEATFRIFWERSFEEVGITGDSLVSEEVRRMGMETAPILFCSVAVMVIFVVACSFRANPIKSKPWESLIGCLIPVLAMITSTAVISSMGIKFQSIVVASLFLVLSVGVDDVFIILRGWDRTDMKLDVPLRLSKTLEEAGPSITISSLTNALSFAIGILSSTPAVRTFSIYSCIAIITCYFYQLVLFTAVLALSGHREKHGFQSLLCCFKANPRAHSCTVENANDLQTVIIKKWSAIISSWSARIVLAMVMTLYYYISITGIQQLHAHISIDKMALPDSYLRDFQEAYETALRNMQPITVFVMKPGDLRDPARMKAIKSLVYEFEHSVFSYGNESTFFWLQQYEDFLRFYGETDDFVYTEIPTFFKSATYFFLSSFVRMNETACYENQPQCISAFFFVTNFHEIVKYHEMIPAVADWRRIAAKYSDYEVYPYSEHSPFVDQTLSIQGTILTSVAAALFCTAAACFVFIPNMTTIGCAVFSVFSISTGVFGLLSHWSVDLDPLSMAALLMAIGCSVDFTAHISYHYYKAIAKNSRDRLEEALTAIGWPMIQVGLSTVVALLPLLFKQSYLAMVFLKTIVVVVVLGVSHGLIVLPAILTMITSRIIESEKKSMQSSSSERSSQGSHSRNDSFYKTKKLVSKINQHFSSTLSSQSLSVGDDKAKRKATEMNNNTVAPVSTLDILPHGPTAFIHRIQLGRTTSISE